MLMICKGLSIEKECSKLIDSRSQTVKNETNEKLSYIQISLQEIKQKIESIKEKNDFEDINEILF